MCVPMVDVGNHGRGPRGSGKPTIDDVARRAGVSRTTVSRVLNNGANVRLAVRETVEEAVESLGFKANVQARSLAARYGSSLALVHQSDLDTEPNSYYHAALELGALRACADGGFQVLTRTVSSDVTQARRQIAEMFSDGRVAGMILTPPLSDDQELRKLGSERGYAFACVSADPDTDLNGPAFGIDDFAAGRDIARHLIELGHRRFGYMHGLSGHRSAARRFSGVCSALDEAGLDCKLLVEEHGTFAFRSGIVCAERMITLDPRPTALICANDDMAAGAMLAMHQNGLEIPGDISVTGFDGTPISEIIWPPLTTVVQPIKQIGYDAASWLIELITNGANARRTNFPVAAHSVALRESTAPPRRT